MSWVVFYSERAQLDCDGLPGEALAALGELEGQLSEHPFLGEQNPNDRLERSADFGKQGQGVVTYMLDEHQQEIWFLGIIWC